MGIRFISVRTYGITADYTITQLESLVRTALMPTDWQQLAKACLNPGQYLDFRSFQAEFAMEQAMVKQQNRQSAWDRDMLLRQGRCSAEQTGYPLEVYEQINQLGIRA